MGVMIWVVLRVLVSLGLVAFLLWRADLGQLGSILVSLRPLPTLLALVVALAAWLLNTYKWQKLLSALGGEAPFGALLALNFVGLFYSLLLPGQIGGEVVKGVKLALAGLGGANAAVSITMDRLTGVVALGAVALLGLALSPSIPGGQAVGWGAALVVVVGLSPVLVLMSQKVSAGPKSLMFPSPHEFPQQGKSGGLLSLRWVETLWMTFLSYRGRYGTLALGILCAVWFQGMVTLSNYLASLGVGLEVPFFTLMWIVAAVSILHMLPISLAGLGVREGAYVFLLHQNGVPVTEGLSLALVVFGIILVQGLLGGLVEVTYTSRGFFAPFRPDHDPRKGNGSG